MVLKGIFSESMYGCVLTCQIQGSSIVLTALSKGTILAKKHWFFAKKRLTSAKLRGPYYWKVYFLKVFMSVYLLAKFQVSSIVLTSFREG